MQKITILCALLGFKLRLPALTGRNPQGQCPRPELAAQA
jgi:hypothetical protein